MELVQVLKVVLHALFFVDVVAVVAVLAEEAVGGEVEEAVLLLKPRSLSLLTQFLPQDLRLLRSPSVPMSPARL